MTILRINEVRQATGYQSPASIYNRVRAGTFTKPVRIGLRSVGWPSDEVSALVSAAIAGHGDDELRALVATLTAKRSAHYQEVVQKLGHTPGEVAQRSAPARCKGRFAPVKG